MRRAFLITALLISISFFCKFWHIYTGGFKISKIEVKEKVKARIGEILPLTEEKKKIFDQEFYFLDKGGQVYVFESSDQKYVIKFLRHHKYGASFWMNLISFSKSGKKFKEKYGKEKKEKLKRVFESYLIGADELLPLTEIVYVHLSKTHLKKKILLKNRGQKYFLDLDNFHFIVQKKVKKLQDELLLLYRQKEMQKMHAWIDQYFDKVKFRALLSICDIDRSGYLRNKGIIDGKIVDIDVGGYRRRNLSGLEMKNFEIDKISNKLIKWSQKNTPLLTEYIQKKRKLGD